MPARREAPLGTPPSRAAAERRQLSWPSLAGAGGGAFSPRDARLADGLPRCYGAPKGWPRLFAAARLRHSAAMVLMRGDAAERSIAVMDAHEFPGAISRQHDTAPRSRPRHCAGGCPCSAIIGPRHAAAYSLPTQTVSGALSSPPRLPPATHYACLRADDGRHTGRSPAARLRCRADRSMAIPRAAAAGAAARWATRHHYRWHAGLSARRRSPTPASNAAHVAESSCCHGDISYAPAFSRQHRRR